MKPGGVGNTTAKTVQDIAKTIAGQMAEEPLEILKDASGQVTGIEQGAPRKFPQDPNENGQPQQDPGQEELKDKAFADRRMRALQTEIDDIKRGEIFKELQSKISDGQIVPLEDYPELSMEQKQVLKAQMEAVRIQKLKFEIQNSVEVPAIHSKPSRRFGAGQKQEAEKAQTRVEKPVPPSG